VVFWTLCLEVQFYLVFIVLLALDQRLAPRSAIRRGGVNLVVVAYAVSLLWPLFTRPGAPYMSAWFGPHWHKFLLGALICQAGAGLLPRRTAYTAVAALAAVVTVRQVQPAYYGDKVLIGYWTALATALLLLVAARRQALYTWLNWRPLLFLGTISYSLYLVHLPVILVCLGLHKRLAATSQVLSLAFPFLTLVLVIGAAVIVYLVIERPSIKLGKHVASRGGRPLSRNSHTTAVELPRDPTLPATLRPADYAAT
jgi:peptidoglycan/LPS O-acetylase OafA/YrhL